MAHFLKKMKQNEPNISFSRDAVVFKSVLTKLRMSEFILKLLITLRECGPN